MQIRMLILTQTPILILRLMPIRRLTLKLRLILMLIRTLRPTQRLTLTQMQKLILMSIPIQT